MMLWKIQVISFILEVHSVLRAINTKINEMISKDTLGKKGLYFIKNIFFLHF